MEDPVSPVPPRPPTSRRRRTGSLEASMTSGSSCRQSTEQRQQQQLLQATAAEAAVDFDTDCEDHENVMKARTLESVEVVLVVHQAQDLVAKDRNWKGEVTSSDPYVICKVITEGNTTSEDTEAPTKKEIVVGKTKVVKESLFPIWNEQFEISLHKDYLWNGSSPPAIQLVIKDHDWIGSNDCLGVITVPLDSSRPVQSKEWYDVPVDSASNASGRLQLSLQTTFIYNDGGVSKAPPPPAAAADRKSVV